MFQWQLLDGTTIVSFAQTNHQIDVNVTLSLTGDNSKVSYQSLSNIP